MLLNQFFKDAPAIEIKQLSCDSRMPMEDCIFFCLRGIKDDGHNFVEEAISNGAKVVIYEKPIDQSLPCIYIKVHDVLTVLNQIASKFYDEPGKDMENFVITGSFGRNSVAFILKDIISHYRSCGYIGSYGIQYNNTKLLSNEPTLTILDNQRYLQAMRAENVEACLFEADSFGLDLQKLDSVNPKALIFTNASMNDDDKHFWGDKAASLRRYLKQVGDVDVIFNADDPLYQFVDTISDIRFTTYSTVDPNADFFADEIEISEEGSSFYLHCFQNTYQVYSNLLGRQNIYNLLAAIATLVERGYPIDEVINACKDLTAPEGIMESIEEGQNYKVIVDSCITYDSMVNALKFAKEVINVKHKIIALFGLNTFSNHEKRNHYGAVLDKYADLIVITEDDAYEESVFQISDDMQSGIKNTPTITIENREDAIAAAVDLLNKGDMLLCLGKGQEKYMYRSLGKERYPGDSVLAAKYIKKRMEEENEII